MTVERDVPLLERQALSGGNPDLLLDDIHPGNEFGHRVLDLDARIHLEEKEVTLVVEEELERPGVGVLHRARGIDDRAAEFAAHLFGHRDRRSFFEQLLMAALNRALALTKVNDRAMVIAEYLKLDMTRVLDVLLEVHVPHAERGFGLPLRGLQRFRQLPRCADHAHPAAAAAGHRFDNHRVPEILGDLLRLLFTVNGAVAARKHWHTGLLHRASRPCLVAEQANDVGGRTDELDMA